MKSSLANGTHANGAFQYSTDVDARDKKPWPDTHPEYITIGFIKHKDCDEYTVLGLTVKEDEDDANSVICSAVFEVARDGRLGFHPDTANANIPRVRAVVSVYECTGESTIKQWKIVRDERYLGDPNIVAEQMIIDWQDLMGKKSMRRDFHVSNVGPNFNGGLVDA